MSALEIMPPEPPLWVEVFHRKRLAAAFADALTAIRCAGILGRETCIVIDPQLREQWGALEKADALPEEIEPQSHVETTVRLRASLADMALRKTAVGGFAIWFGELHFAEVAPEGLSLAHVWSADSADSRRL